MSLPRPLRRLVDATPPGDAVDRMWQAIDGRRTRRRPRPRTLAFAVTLAAAAAAVFVVARRPSPAPRPATLALADGHALPPQLTTSARLSDGSTLTLTDAHLDVLEADATRATFLLRDGRAHFDVVPHGPRRWTIECGLAAIEVVGTTFTIDRTDASVTVTVDHGVVLVRSPRLPDGIRRLTATETLTISAPEPAPEPVSSSPALQPSALQPSALQPSALQPSALQPSALQPSSPPPSASTLLATADDLRRRGDLPAASAILARVMALPDDPLAGVAAFTRANLNEELGRPTEARADLRRALDLGLPPALAARARARLEAP